MASASSRQAFLQEDAEKAHQVWRAASDGMRPRWPGDFAARNAELGVFMDDSEHDVLAYTRRSSPRFSPQSGGMAA